MNSGLEFVKVWHRVFSQNLAYIIEGVQPDQSAKVEVISNSGICQVGRWLSAQKPDVTELPAFLALVTVHDEYHRLAGQSLRHFQEGGVEQAREIIHSTFTLASEGVCQQIDALETELATKGLVAPRFKSEDVARSHTFWNASFEVGIESVDRRHHAIATMIEELSASSVGPVSQNEASTFLRILTNLIMDDIKSETPILEKHRDSDNPYFADHMAAHDEIAAHLADLSQQVANGVAISVKEVGTFFSKWFVNHLVVFDLELPEHIDFA